MKGRNTVRLALALAASLIALPLLAGQPVNVNSADASTIAEGLDGVGQVKAERIVEYRKANGDFDHADELINVKGIGLRTVDRNRDNIKLAEAGSKG